VSRIVDAMPSATLVTSMVPIMYKRMKASSQSHDVVVGAQLEHALATLQSSSSRTLQSCSRSLIEATGHARPRPSEVWRLVSVFCGQ
jgi:hypothetical protein